MKNPAPVLSVVIISFNTKEVLRECLNKVVLETQSIPSEIIVVDNASTDGSPDMVAEEFPQINLIHSSINLGFGPANNLGFQQCHGRFVALINSDLLLHPSVLAECINRLQREGSVAAAGIQLMGEKGDLQPSSRVFPTPIRDLLERTGWFNLKENNNPYPDWIPGAFVIVRKQLLDSIGWFDERFFMYYEEVDLCKRLQTKGKIRFWEDLSSTHLGGASLQKVNGQHVIASRQIGNWRFRSAYLYYRKHYGFLGAWSYYLMECGWQYLRILRNVNRKDKKEESKLLLQLYKQSWKDTQGGKIAPPIPW